MNDNVISSNMDLLKAQQKFSIRDFYLYQYLYIPYIIQYILFKSYYLLIILYIFKYLTRVLKSDIKSVFNRDISSYVFSIAAR